MTGGRGLGRGPRRTLLIARRELSVRIGTRGFWIGTLVVPVFLALWVLVPPLVWSSTVTTTRIGLLDETETIAPVLQRVLEELSRQGSPVRFDAIVLPTVADGSPEEAGLDRRVADEELDAWLEIRTLGLDADRVELHLRHTTNLILRYTITEALREIVSRHRLRSGGFPEDTVLDLLRPVRVVPVRIASDGRAVDGGQGFGELALALGLFVLLQVSITIYGQIVMHGVMEEKTSHVVDVLVTAARPREILAGKLAGICGASLLQLGLWLATAAWAGTSGLAAALPASVRPPALAPSLVLHVAAFFLLGYLMYSSFYALVGAAFRDPTEAQQVATVGVFSLMAPWAFALPIVNDPDSVLATVSSLVPLLTPLLMPFRLVLTEVPAPEVAVAYAGTLLLDILLLGLCARVYRLGILSPSKPGLRAILRALVARDV